jgi:hypothetical protein
VEGDELVLEVFEKPSQRFSLKKGPHSRKRSAKRELTTEN